MREHETSQCYVGPLCFNQRMTWLDQREAHTKIFYASFVSSFPFCLLSSKTSSKNWILIPGINAEDSEVIA